MPSDKPAFIFGYANDNVDDSRFLRNLGDERRRTRKALAEAADVGRCELVECANATVREIIDDCQRRSGRVAVFHFAGHADGRTLVFEQVDGSADVVPASSLAEFLGGLAGLKLVFLNGCSTQEQVDALRTAGVPAVIATSTLIRDDIATEIAARFYGALTKGATIGDAFRQASGAVKAQFHSTGTVRERPAPTEVFRSDARDLAPRPVAPGLAAWPWALHGDAQALSVRVLPSSRRVPTALVAALGLGLSVLLLTRFVGTVSFGASAGSASASSVAPAFVTGSNAPMAELLADRSRLFEDSTDAADPERAVTTFRMACDAGNQDGCAALASAAFQGRGMAADKTLSLRMAGTSCAAGAGLGCVILGRHYELGIGVELSSERAADLFEKGCGGGAAVGCLSLGLAYETGTGRKKNEPRAVELYRRACDAKEPYACVALGKNYSEGIGVAPDPNEAVALFKKGCALKHSIGCYNVGIAFQGGRGTELDPKEAARFYQLSCDLEYVPACADLANMYFLGQGVPVDTRRGIDLFERACEAKNAFACYSLGAIYATAQSVPLDEKRGVALFTRACNGGNMDGCSGLGMALLQGRGGLTIDLQEATKMFEKACEGGSAAGCTGRGMTYEQGPFGHLPDALRLAANYYGQGCAGGDMAGCYYLGNLYGQGRGVEPDGNKAKALWRQACDGGFDGACRLVRP